MSTLGTNLGLDDVIIDVSLKIAIRRNNEEKTISSLSYSEFDWFLSLKALIGDGKQKDLLNYNTCLIPINFPKRVHWVLAVVRGTDVQILDSLNWSKGNGLGKLVTEFLNAIERRDYVISFPEVPQQPPGVDCGMFVYMHGCAACSGKAFDIIDLSRQFLVNDIAKYRIK